MLKRKAEKQRNFQRQLHQHCSGSRQSTLLVYHSPLCLWYNRVKQVYLGRSTDHLCVVGSRYD